MKVLTSSLLAAVSLTAVAALPAAAQPAPDTAQPADEPYVETGSHINVYGAMRDPATADAPAAPEDQGVPELPVVYEDEAEPSA